MSGTSLLKLHIDGWLNARGRLPGLRGIAAARSDDAAAFWVGDSVPDGMADHACQVLHRASHGSQDSLLAAPDRVASILQTWTDEVRRRDGPYYLIDPNVRFAATAPVEVSGGAWVDHLRGRNPGNWHRTEWDELLDGQLGPWAMAVEDRRVIAICHTPRPMSPITAECGVWTDPAFRGRGHASTVTAAWAELVRTSGRHLFYSTDAENASSRRVAERLNLREVGWMWRIERAGDEAAARYHPLSRLNHAPDITAGANHLGKDHPEP
jgi:RimJ/RimL family protein N-acetyltransferase